MAENVSLIARSTTRLLADARQALEELLSTSQALWVILKGGVWDYGTWPQNSYLDINGIVPATLSQDIFVSTDISIYDALVFDLYAIAGTTPAIKAYPSFDGVTRSATPLALTDLSSGALGTAIPGATGATVVGNYMLAIPMKARFIALVYTSSVVGATGASIRGGIWKR